MAVVIETTLGDITVDLYLEKRPATCLNFLKLCKMKFYNFNLFHTIRSGFIAQTGDPSGEGSGGQSIWGLIDGPEKQFFSGEKMPKIRHTDAGLLSMVCNGDMMVGSQFFFTLGTHLDSLDGVHCVIGEVTEGHDVLRKLNEVICDETHRPYRDVRITHTVVLEDPFSDPPALRAPSRSPSPCAERLKGGRIAPDEELDETQGKSAEEIQEIIEEKEAKARATILEIVGDLPDADIAPPENVLFVCKLNPVTSDEDLEIIFSRFGKIVSCEVIRDKKTGDSLQYAFIEFSDKKSCENAYFKMDNVLIDDRRIHVDFSQSVSKIKWLGKGRGVKHMHEEDTNSKNIHYDSKKGNDRNSNHRRERYDSRSEDRGRQISSNKEKYDNKQRTNDFKKSRDHREKSKSRDRSLKCNSYRDSLHKKSSRNPQTDNEHKNHSYSDDNNRNLNYYESSSSKMSPVRSKIASSSRIENKKTRKDSERSHRHDKEKKDEDSSDKYQSDNKRQDELIDKYNDKVSKHKESDKKNRENLSNNNSRIKYIRNNNDNIQYNKFDNKLNVSDTTDSKSDEHNHRSHRDSKLKRKRTEEDSDKDNSKKTKQSKIVKPKTSSTVVDKRHKMKNKTEKSETVKKSLKHAKKVKKTRKPSTSSSDSSESTSSSSSDSSTSSESDYKKRTIKKRKKRYYSSSSSSSTDSTTSSSSDTSDSSSDSSSSSSDSNHKKSKIKKKNINKKSRQRSKK